MKRTLQLLPVVPSEAPSDPIPESADNSEPPLTIKKDVPLSDDECIILDETGIAAPILPALKIERSTLADGLRYENACQQLLNLIKLASRESQTGAASTSTQSDTVSIDVDSEDSDDSVSIISSECQTTDDDDSRSSVASTASKSEGAGTIQDESESDSCYDELAPPTIITHAKNETSASEGVIIMQLEDVSDTEMPEPPAATVNGDDKAPAGNIKLRAWSNKCYCCYCTAGPLRNLERHLTDHHRSVWEVTTLLKETDMRKKAALCRHIRNLGNHRHNIKVLERGRGVLIVGRLSTRDKMANCYKPCTTCYEYFVKSRRWRHQCYRVRSKDKRKVPTPGGATKRLNRRIKKDELAVVVKLDTTLQMYAKDAVKVHKKRASHVTQKLRQAGKLLLLVRQQTGKMRQKVADVIVPKNFPAVTTAIRKLAKFDEKTGSYGKPKLARRLYAMLSRCAFLRKENCLKKKKELGSRVEQYEQFYKLAAEFRPDEANGKTGKVA